MYAKIAWRRCTPVTFLAARGGLPRLSRFSPINSNTTLYTLHICLSISSPVEIIYQQIDFTFFILLVAPCIVLLSYM